MTDTIKRLRELLAKAAPGPWIIYDSKRYPHIKTSDGHYIQESGSALRRYADATLIVAAINTLPALLDVAEAARLAATEPPNLRSAFYALQDALAKLDAVR